MLKLADQFRSDLHSRSHHDLMRRARTGKGEGRCKNVNPMEPSGPNLQMGDMMSHRVP